MLSGIRVLLVEDESAIAMLLEDFLAEIGCTVVGSANRLDKALALAGEVAADVAVLDVNLSGKMSYPVADLLGGRGIPVVFATGYGETGLPERFRGAPVLTKPFRCETLEESLQQVIGSSGQGGDPSAC